jgi:hypothetical protein
MKLAEYFNSVHRVSSQTLTCLGRNQPPGNCWSTLKRPEWEIGTHWFARASYLTNICPLPLVTS